MWQKRKRDLPLQNFFFFNAFNNWDYLVERERGNVKKISNNCGELFSKRNIFISLVYAAEKVPTTKTMELSYTHDDDDDDEKKREWKKREIGGRPKGMVTRMRCWNFHADVKIENNSSCNLFSGIRAYNFLFVGWNLSRSSNLHSMVIFNSMEALNWN